MGKFLQLVIGPAGVGKSTYCKTMQEHGATTGRTIHVGNLDPAAEDIQYEPSFDVRDLIKLDEIMDETGFGPNGGLVLCMELVMQHIDWLQEQLDQFGEDDYVILDCPGQVELYSHLPIMKTIVNCITSWGYRLVVVYLIDSLFVLEPAKFISGCMLSLSCMIQLEQPFINVITKCDMADKNAIEMVLDSEGTGMITQLDRVSNPRLKQLSRALGSVIDDYMLVSFSMLDITDDESIEEILYKADHAIQYGEDLEPKDLKDDDLLEEDGQEDGDDRYHAASIHSGGYGDF